MIVLLGFGWLGWVLGECEDWTGTYALDDLEEDDAQEEVDLRSLLVRPAHLGAHPLRKSTCGFERAGYDQDAGEEEPQVGV